MKAKLQNGSKVEITGAMCELLCALRNSPATSAAELQAALTEVADRTKMHKSQQPDAGFLVVVADIMEWTLTPTAQAIVEAAMPIILRQKWHRAKVIERFTGAAELIGWYRKKMIERINDAAALTGQAIETQADQSPRKAIQEVFRFLGEEEEKYAEASKSDDDIDLDLDDDEEE